MIMVSGMSRYVRIHGSGSGVERKCKRGLMLGVFAVKEKEAQDQRVKGSDKVWFRGS